MEYLYALYIFSGIIKAFLNFHNISLPIDFTLLTGSLLFAGLGFHVLIKGIIKFDAKSVFLIYLLLFFYLWINLTILYSVSSNYAYQKSFLFLTNVLAFIIPLLYGRFDIKKFVKLFVILTPILGVAYLIYLPELIYLSADDPERSLIGLYLTLPLFCGLCVLIHVTMKELFPPIFNVMLIILNSLVIILSGGRGPIIFTVATLVLYVIANFFSTHLSSRKKIYNLTLQYGGVKKIFSLTFVISFAVFLSMSFVPDVEMLFDRSYERLLLLFQLFSGEDAGSSATARLNHFAFSSNLIFYDIKSLLFGYGLGSYGVLSGSDDGRGYPHNMFLEIWVETGLIGILCVFAFFITLIYACRRHLNVNPFKWLVLCIFLNTMKSSSLVDLRLFFGFLAIMVLHSKLMQSRFIRCH